MKIIVTAEDIANGKRFLGCECPIALAIRRATDIWWRVVYARAENEEGGRMVLPAEAITFQQSFDAGCAVKPFSFEVQDA